MTPFGSLVVLLLLFLVPGLGASYALYRTGELEVATRLALALGLGYAITAFSAYLLILAGLYYAVPAFVLVGVATISAWAVAGVRRHTGCWG